MTWPRVALGEVATWGSGGTPRRSERGYFGDGVPWLSIADLNDGVVSTAKESLTPLGIQNSSAKVVPEGTIFVAMYGSIGKLGIAGREMCTSQAIAFAKPNPGIVDTRYLFHYLLSQRPQLQNRGRGGTQMNIGQTDLKRWPMPLPPLEEQRRIAAILDRADEVRSARDASLHSLPRLRRSIFHDLFEASDRSWKRVALSNLVRDQQLGLVRAASEQGAGRHYEYVKMDSISSEGDFIANGLTRVDATSAEIARYTVCEGDLLFNTRNSRELVGKSAIYRGPDRLFNNNLMRLRLVDEALPEYIHGYLWSNAGRSELEKRKSGTTSVFAVYSKNLLSMSIPLPPVGEQHKYVSALHRIRMHREWLDASGSRLTDMAQSLAAAAFSGQV